MFYYSLLVVVLPETAVKMNIQSYVGNAICRQFIYFMVTVEQSQKMTEEIP